MHEEDEPTTEEAREAEALARALERGHAPDPPADALGAAALIRFARRGASLSEERHETLLAEVVAGARRARHPARRFFLVSALGLSMAAALAIVVSRTGREDSAPLPSPPSTLLSAELDAARSVTGSVATLD